jgi:hypothetical protein
VLLKEAREKREELRKQVAAGVNKAGHSGDYCIC